ncbi:MAG: DNA-directed RNA polymerase subunit beta' [Thermotogae bacterium]|nr:DNA-directed RNA polymerase subunit beta' [Thermotogota bacterium]
MEGTRKISAVRIGIASPERIRQLSSGEVKKPETINYRTFKPENDGLFCEKIFGPTKDYECACGKYKGKKYEGTVCERCGVRVESRDARRRRLGHIELAVPVVHIWYLKSTPSVIATLLNIPTKELESIVYYSTRRVIEGVYLVTDPKDTPFERGEMLYDTEYKIYQKKWDFDVEQAVIVRNAQTPLLSDTSGIVEIKTEITSSGRELTWIKVKKVKRDEYNVHRGMILEKEPGSEVKKGEVLVQEVTVEPIYAPFEGKVEYDEETATLRLSPLKTSKEHPATYTVPYGAKVLVKNGVKVKPGDQLTSETTLPSIVAESDGKLILSQEVNVRPLEDGKYEIMSDGKLFIETTTEERNYPVFEGAAVLVMDGDEVQEGDPLADRFLFDDEVLTVSEYKIFESYYPGKFTVETSVETDKPILLITEIDPEVSKETGRKVGDVILESEYEAYQQVYPGKVEALYGAPAIKKLLENLDLEELKTKLEAELKSLPKSSARALKILKRLKLVKDFIKSGNRPEWMVLEAIPVIPPELRPMIQIDGGRFATTDLNDLYRRVINRNNRLKKLMDLNAPEIIIRNEKRMLQEAVDSLIYNGRAGKEFTDRNGRPLKSLTDLVKGKKGRFRRNLLGKRVDYSGRAVIVVGPHLKIHECGLPKKMALELFKPFVLAKLLSGMESSKAARKLKKAIIERELPEAWEVLEEVIKGHPVLLNRAPTLHRISIQAFIPRLIEGNAIQLHPLVCPPFNADFDGDQMAVHVPLSAAAQAEAKFLMLSRYNIISPAHGKPISMPGKDIIVGLYYLTVVNRGYDEVDPKDIKWRFSSPEEALLAHHFGYIGLHSPILVKLEDGKLHKTTVGRLIFNEILPKDLRDYDKTFGKKEIKDLVYESFQRYGIDRTADLLDDLKDLGFHYATVSGLTISMKDVVISPRKEEIIEKAKKLVERVEREYAEGYLAENERYRTIIKIWQEATDEVQKATYEALAEDPFNPVFMMVNSGARGNIDQVKQLSGMRGLMADPSGRTIEVPITSNFREGLTEIEFFISTHGARKGSADTALRTSSAGYLTRRLVDVAQGVTVTIPDCGTEEGVEAVELISDDLKVEKLKDFIFGRVLADDVIDPETKEVVSRDGRAYTRDVMVEEKDAEYLSKYMKVVKVFEEKVLDLEKGEITPHYAEIEEPVYGENGEELYPAGTPLSRDVISAARKVGMKSIKITEYPAVGAVYVGNESDVTIHYKDLGITRRRTLLKYQEKIEPRTAKLLKEELKRVKALVEQDRELFNLNKHAMIFADGKIKVRPVIKVRSVLTCEAEHGVCAKCFGMDLSNHKIVNVGEAVGIIAAQSIGEPGTQLTMRTFHTGGIATAADITQGLPRAEELFEARKKLKEKEAIFSEVEGFVEDITSDDKETKRIIIRTVDGETVEIRVPLDGKPKVHPGQKVMPGDPLTTGAIKPRRLMEKVGVMKTALYLLQEIKRVYAEQGVDIHDKHFEIIIRQMLSKVEVVDPGDTDLLPGDLVSYQEIKRINREILEANSRIDENREKVVGKKLAKHVLAENEEGEVEEVAVEGQEITPELIDELARHSVKEIEVDINGNVEKVQILPKDPVRYRRKLLRITKASLEKEGWLSAASFQQTPQVLTEASVEGSLDKLQGLKENVIVGQLIPAGTGYELYSDIQIEEMAIAVAKERRTGTEILK